MEGLLLTVPEIVISVQVLNELANVLLKKYGQSEAEVKTRLNHLRLQSQVVFLTDEMSLQALDLKARYHFGWYDSLIAVAALEADCQFLYSEDFQDGLIIEKRLHVVNPFNI